MSKTFTFNIEKRTDLGKGASRRLRKKGLIPAIIYGNGLKPIEVLISHKEIIRCVDNEALYSQISILKLNNDNYKVLVKDIQFHPYKNLVMHLDFLSVTEKTIVDLSIPFNFINEDICVGVKNQGGIISHQASDALIRAEVGKLPNHIDVDMAEVKIGHIIHLSDIKLEKDVQFLSLINNIDEPIAKVEEAKTLQDEDESENKEDKEEVETKTEK